MPIRIFKILMLIFSFVACVSSSKLERPKDFIDPKPALDLENLRSYYFSSDGKSLLYVAEILGRSPQIFLRNLESQRVRQITHQVGEIYEVAFMPGEQEIIYTSTTDEEKENPILLQMYLNPETVNHEERNTEIYISNMNGSNIRRLTKHQGFDGYVDVHPTRGEIIFTEKGAAFYKIRLAEKQKKPRNYISLNSNEKLPRFSPDGNILLWLSDRNGKLQFVLRENYPKTAERLLPLDGFHRVDSVAFHPNSQWILFSAKKDEHQNIFAMRLKDACLMQVTFSKSLDQQPHFHPDGKSWYFVSNRKDKVRLWQSTYFPSEACKPKAEVEKN